MDLRSYYQRIRELEESFPDGDVVIRSVATSAGGKAGRVIEAPPKTAARMIVDGTAELASEEETKGLYLESEKARRQAEEQRKSAQVQFNVISEADLRALTRSGRGRKE